ncbi:MAG: hypothetical protein ACYTFG_12515 [Planctomycetota bacterium]|jgi:hypothetical protein
MDRESTEKSMWLVVFLVLLAVYFTANGCITSPKGAGRNPSDGGRCFQTASC